MKFGIQFDFHKIPEWSEYYLDYKILKKLLKQNMKKLEKLAESKNRAANSSLKKICSSKTLYRGSKDRLLDEENEKEQKMAHRKNSIDNCESSSNSLEMLHDTEEILNIWKEKFIEFVNVVNTFFKSKFLENKEEFEGLIAKMEEKRKEHQAKRFIGVVNEHATLEDDIIKSFKKSMGTNIERDELGINN
jgi:SPX domain protein involved in polyphosphate accumulation